MDRKKIIQGLSEGKSFRQIAKFAGCSHTAVKLFGQGLQSQGISLDEAKKLSEKQLDMLFAKGMRSPQAYAEPDWRQVQLQHSSIKHPVPLTVCYQIYADGCQKKDEVMSYKTFTKRYKQYVDGCDELTKNEDAGRRVWNAGDAGMIDYSGDKFKACIDGVDTDLCIFVAVLPYSQLAYIFATPDQTRESWFRGIRGFFEYIKGVPKYLILDNSTTCIAKASKTWPKYSKDFVRFCRYYGVLEHATEPGMPLAKPDVEGMVKLVQRNILNPFYGKLSSDSLAGINAILKQKLDNFNNRPLSIDPSECRFSIFNAEEAPTLKKLKPIPWGSDVQIKRLLVRNDGFVRYKNRRYRVNSRYIGHHVNVVAVTQECVLRLYSDKNWNFIQESPLRMGIAGKQLTIDNVKFQNPKSQYMQESCNDIKRRFEKPKPLTAKVIDFIMEHPNELDSARFFHQMEKWYRKLGKDQFEAVLSENPFLTESFKPEEMMNIFNSHMAEKTVLKNLKSGTKLEVNVKENKNLRGRAHYDELAKRSKK